MPQNSELRRRNVGHQDNTQHNRRIVVRGRPVNGYGSYVATHCFLALLDINTGAVIDSLSFDPSNSDGAKDAKPNDNSRGEIIVQSPSTQEQWNGLKESYKKFAEGEYNLKIHNCCHAVMKALVDSNLTYFERGIEFAHEANSTWQDLNQHLPPKNYIKKNV